MAPIPTPIRKWIDQRINAIGGGGTIPADRTVATYGDLPLAPLSGATEWYFVQGEEDVVVASELDPVQWRSVFDQEVVASAIPDSGLFRYTYEDDGDLSTVTDVYNNNNGTINGDPTYTTTGANEGSALDLDGTGDYVDSGVAADVSNSWSAATYIHGDDLGTDDEFFIGATEFGVLGTFNSGSDVGVFVQDDSNTNQTCSEPTSNLSNQTLYHLVGVYDSAGTEFRYYRDGSKIDTTDVSGSSFSTTNNWLVGARGDATRELDGRVDQTDVYTTALSDSEVSDLYSTGSILTLSE